MMGSWFFRTCPTTVNSVPAEKLGEYVQNFLRPSDDCQRQIDAAVDTICAALQDTKELPTVTDVAKGGSYGRKTVLRGNSDGTLVIFISDLEQFQDLKRKDRQEILNKICERLHASQLGRKLAARMEIKRPCEGLTIQLSTKWQSITFDVLPAFDAVALSDKPSPWTYRELKRSLDTTKASPGEFSVCFTKLQQNFFNHHPRKLKDLILLVKAWYQQCQKKLKDASQPPSYALELLTVYAWEQGCEAEDFDLVEGIRTVLGLIKRPEDLCVYWTVNYNFEDVTVRNVILSQIRSPRPVILDPTDPTNNVSKDKSCWQLLKEEAQLWLSSPSLKESPGPSWNVLPMPLHETPGHRLDAFIKLFLQPDQTFLDQMSRAVDVICTFFKKECFRHSTTKVQKSVKGGSTSKGTALKTGSDADIVLFIDSLQSYTSQQTERGKVVKEIRKQLEAFQQREARERMFEVKFEISKWDAPKVLSFSLKSKELSDSVDFDVLPAYNALDQVQAGCRPHPRIYTELISLYKSSYIVEGEFSTCFTELQRNFVLSRPTKLKDLIRLMKHWYKQCARKLKGKGSLPPKYALELLTIYAWEQGSGAVDFDTAEGFGTVLELVTRYQQLCIFWMVNYNFENEIVRNFLLTQIRNTRPVILDPADPTGDVGGGHRWCWNLLAQEANEWLSSSLCFKDGAGAPVPRWNVPVGLAEDLGRPKDSRVSAGSAYGRDLSPPLPPPPPPPPSLPGAQPPPPPTRGIPASGSRLTRPSVGGVVCPRVESPAPRARRPRGQGRKGRGGETAAPSHSGGSPGGGGAEARAAGEQRRGEARLGGRSRARVGWGVPTGPRPPRSPAQLRSRSLGGRTGDTRRTPPPYILQPPRPSRTLWSRDQGDRDTPFSRSRRWGADPRRGQQPHRSQEQGLGRSCHLGRRGLGGHRREQQAGPGLWASGGDRPVALTGKKDRRPAGKRLDPEQGRLPHSPVPAVGSKKCRVTFPPPKKDTCFVQQHPLSETALLGRGPWSLEHHPILT